MSSSPQPVITPKPRPLPPDDLREGALVAEDERFVPAGDLGAWARETFLDAGAPLWNPDHEHLQMARLGWLWTNAGNRRQMRTVIATAEIPLFRGSPWVTARQEQQMRDWFGALPDFVVTVSAPFAAACTDAQLCAVLEHELYHCSQLGLLDGDPKFTRDGLPKWSIRGHDVEEFVGVVARYGAKAAGVEAMAAAWAHGPLVDTDAIAGACGTCMAKV